MPNQTVSVKPIVNDGAAGKAPFAMGKSEIFAISQPRKEKFRGTDIDMDKVEIVDFVNDELNTSKDKDTVVDKEDDNMTSLKPPHPFMYRDRMSWMAVLYSLIPDAVGVSGIKYAVNFNENKIRRLFWLILILAGFSLTFIQVWGSIHHYFRYPTNIDIHVEYESELPLPAIAICNINRYRRELTEGTPFGNLVSSFAFAKVQGDGDSFNLADYEESLNGTNMTQLLLDLGHPLKNTIFLVKLGIESIPVSNFSVKITDYGVCYTFNSGEDGRPPVYIKASGSTFGLSVILNARQDWYYFEELNRSVAGFHIILYERGTEPVQDLGFSIEPGTATNVALRMQEVNNLPPKHGDCNTKELVNYPYYGQNECYNECMADYITGRCGCKAPMLPGNAPHCDPIQYFGCGISAYAQFLQERSHACDCPNPCFQRNFIREMSYSSYPSNFVAEIIARDYIFTDENFTDDFIKQNIASMTVFFKDLTIEQVNQTIAYDLFSLMSDIGGGLGLWLGGSILTIFEFFDLFGHSVYLYSRKAR